MNVERIQNYLRKSLNRLNRFSVCRNDDKPRILCYHRIEPVPRDRWSVSNKEFSRQMEFLKSEYHPVSLNDIVEWRKDRRSLPERAVAITFDDGLVDVYRHAYPVLQKFDISATIFVCPDLMTDVCHESGSRSNDSEKPFMTWDQVRELASSGWVVGSHSLTHPVLSTLDDSVARKEIADSKKRIERGLQKSCMYFCYPYGTPKAVTYRERDLVLEAGYVAGFSSITGYVCENSDLLALPRSKVLALDDFRIFRGILAGRMDPWSIIERLH